MDLQHNLLTSQLEQLKLQKDQLFQEYITLLTFDTVSHREIYVIEIPKLKLKLQKIKVQYNHLQFILTQRFLEHARTNDKNPWSESDEQLLVLESFIKKTDIRIISKLLVRTPYCINKKIKEIQKK